MEAYKSVCPSCGRNYRWIGYKTGLGKTPKQLEKMKKDHTVCKFCGSDKLNTDLDDIGLIEALEERQTIQDEAKEFGNRLMKNKGLL